MAKYRLYQNHNEKSTGYGKYYAQRASQGTVPFNELCKRFAARHTTFSEGEMLGLVTDMVTLVRELAYQGFTVKIDNLGLFWIGIKSKGVANAADFSADSDITAKWKCRGTGEGSGKSIGVTRAGGVELAWEEDNTYQSPRAAAAVVNP